MPRNRLVGDTPDGSTLEEKIMSEQTVAIPAPNARGSKAKPGPKKADLRVVPLFGLWSDVDQAYVGAPHLSRDTAKTARETHHAALVAAHAAANGDGA